MRTLFLRVSVSSLSQVEYDPQRPQAYPTDLLRSFLAKDVYGSQMTWDSERNWRSRKIRFPVVLQELLIQVAAPVLKKNGASLRDFVARLRKRFSSSNTPTRDKNKEDASESRERVSHTPRTPKKKMSESCFDTTPPSTEGRNKSVYRPKSQSDKRAESDREETDSEAEILPPAKKVRTPGTKDMVQEEEETEERRKARLSVENYYRMKNAMSAHESDYEPSNPSGGELEYSSDEI